MEKTVAEKTVKDMIVLVAAKEKFETSAYIAKQIV